MSQTTQIRMNKLYRLIDFCLQLADIADQKRETPFNDVLHTGYGAFSAYMRQGVKEVIDLKQDYYNALYRRSIAEQSKKEMSDYLEDVFGDPEPYTINDKDKERIKAFVKSIMKEWDMKGGEDT
jgi:hypothetical protein